MKMRFKLLSAVLASLSTTLFATEQLRLSGVLFGSDSPSGFNQGVTSGTLSFSRSGSYASTTGSASFGRVQIDLTGAATTTKSGYATSGGYWTDTITVTPDDPALLGTPCTLAITFHLLGSQTANNLGYSATSDEVVYDVYGEGGTLYEGLYSGYLGGFSGTQIGTLANFVWSRPVNLGSPISFETHLSGKVDVNHSGTPPSGSVHAVLSQGSITVLDSTGSPISFSATSGLGAARAHTYSTGGNLAGFGLTNNLGLHSSLNLLAGNAGSTTTNVAAAFVPNPATNAALASDVVDLSGTQTNKFTLSMSFDLSAISQAVEALDMLCLYYDPAAKKWVSAITANSDGGISGRAFIGAFNSNVHTNLGDHGVDAGNHVTWAVLDHNSVFAVGKLIAPPVLQWTKIVFETNGPALTLSGLPNAQYVLEYASDLKLTNWTALGNITLNTNGVAKFTDTNGLGQVRFYRARQ